MIWYQCNLSQNVINQSFVVKYFYLVSIDQFITKITQVKRKKIYMIRHDA